MIESVLDLRPVLEVIVVHEYEGFDNPFEGMGLSKQEWKTAIGIRDKFFIHENSVIYM